MTTSNDKSVSAGILPVHVDPVTRECHVLLGLERHSGWSAFSGKSEHGETDEQAAMREFKEESCETFHEHMVRWWFDANRIHKHESSTRKGRRMVLYVVRFDCDNIHRTSEVFERRREREHRECMLEKTHVCWFPLDRVQHVKLRGCFERDWPELMEIIRSKPFLSSSLPRGEASKTPLACVPFYSSAVEQRDWASSERGGRRWRWHQRDPRPPPPQSQTNRSSASVVESG